MTEFILTNRTTAIGQNAVGLDKLNFHIQKFMTETDNSDWEYLYSFALGVNFYIDDLSKLVEGLPLEQQQQAIDVLVNIYLKRLNNEDIFHPLPLLMQRPFYIRTTVEDLQQWLPNSFQQVLEYYKEFQHG